MSNQDGSNEIFFSDHTYSSNRPNSLYKLHLLVGENKVHINPILDLLEIKPNSKRVLVLEAGSGHGACVDLMSSKGYTVVGADISNSRVKKSHRVYNESSGYYNQNASVITSDLTRAPFKQEAFHICFCSFFLHHFVDIKHIIYELSNSIKNRGEFLIYEPNGLNILYKLTEFVKKITPRNWMMQQGINTLNETIHPPKLYVTALKIQGFEKIKLTFYNSPEQECQLNGKVVKTFLNAFGLPKGILMLCRFLILKTVSKLPQKHLSCGNLVIHGRKQFCRDLKS